MSKLLTRFWFDSDEGLGVGVTAYSLDDAKSLIESESLMEHIKPKLNSYIENIDIQKLDQNHVIPNMGICANRGIWFPNVK